MGIYCARYLCLEMEMVPDPLVEDHETGSRLSWMAICFELGKATVEARYIVLLRSYLFQEPGRVQFTFQ